ncbi:MAG TPA: S49 family peptidase [Hydrogenophaga sp.]|uniref:S49 family peptidase n=1 Tax=Hydrogenophaga sp. TaxID=1904254 RepID=UPI002C8CED58|nr:S49 family peptidase [Hydrogenophaga sp.]HMN93892.1 S49 family peptidase [Hydrogenophaga sp.]HMP11674.1 S49 family peptidase [Hydrogenophaga sp.]
MSNETAGGDGRWERETLEKLVFQTLREQRSQRRWRIFTRLLWLSLFVVVIWLVYQSGRLTPSPSTPHTAVVEIRGAIAAGSEASADQVIGSLRAAFEDSGSRGVVLLINSPGGSPVQAGIINDEIFRLKGLHGKPVYAVVGDTCASAAYYIASAADAIYVNKASIVGSIGVLMDGFGFTGLMEKVGVERRLMTAGENKAFLDPFSPQDEEQRAYIQGMLDEIHRQFIEVVRKGRGDRLKEDAGVFTGLIWSGQQAVSIGLADGLGTLDSVARDLIQAEDIVDYTQREHLGLRLVRSLGASIGEGIARAAGSTGIQLR